MRRVTLAPLALGLATLGLAALGVVSLGTALIGGGFSLADIRLRTAITIHRDAVWVYHTSLCARPGDPTECNPIQSGPRPAFTSHEACSVHRDIDLARDPNPRLLGSCQKQHEA